MSDRQVLLGVIGRPHGVRGLLHVQSYATDPAALAEYGPLSAGADGRGRQFTLRWKAAGVAEVAEIVGGKPVPVADRNAAEKLVNTRLHVARALLPKPDADEFYLADLVGLRALGPDGAELGQVQAVHDYGAGASLEIGALLVPFTRAHVPVVDIAAGCVTVHPPAEIIAAPDHARAAE